MTKKDYIKMARLFAENRPTADIHSSTYNMWYALLMGMLDICKTDNERFDVARFKQAAHEILIGGK